MIRKAIKSFNSIPRINYEIDGILSPDPLVSHMAKWKNYGWIVKEELVQNFPTVTLFHPDFCAQLLKQEGSLPIRPPPLPLVYYRESRGLGSGLGESNGMDWLNIRNKAQRILLKPMSVSSYLPAQNEVSLDFIQRLKTVRNSENIIPDMYKELKRWSLESMATVCFDQRLNLLSTEQINDCKSYYPEILLNNIEHIHKGISELIFSDWNEHIKNQTPLFRNTMALLDEQTEITMKLIESADKSGALLNHLSREMSPESLNTLIIDLLNASIETTANGVIFLLYLLSKNLLVQDRLRDEINAIVINQPLKQGHIDDMPYLRAVYKEATRLFPVSTFIVRVLQENGVIGDYEIPKNIPIFYSNMVAGHLNEFFFESDNFNPNRWLNSKKKPHPYAVLHFGHGPRMCIGKRFAVQETFLGLIQLVRNFKIEYIGSDIGLRMRLFNTPDREMSFQLTDVVRK
ncbi:DgyrCDS7121 [Dimorphilus gyrociliatus]|uniref:DgyrCDS7121 n=1 Tax=Dimorphilus gyrociliatus TaxID=2664684 RepID=A0A7I8VQS7_9ANNE|nr:DgyrCDS7121 [Dimorphilus gyrociliatus]